jgi:MFS family permease
MTLIADNPIDSPAAWRRLATSLAVGSVGCVGFWSYVVALPAVQADFGVTRAEASLPYTLIMTGFGFGGLFMGWVTDRFGVFSALVGGAAIMAVAYGLAGLSVGIVSFALAQLLLGVGCSACFSPLMADISHWFERRRGLAVTLVSSGNYVAGAVWPPVIQYVIETQGWRAAHFGLGLLCIAVVAPLAFLLRAAPPTGAGAKTAPKPLQGIIAMPPGVLLALICAAGFACCMAMAMPQVHLVAYCADLGYGPAQGAQMLSIMLALGIASRIISGFVCDRIGGLLTLLIGSAAQGLALVLYMFFDGLTSLYLISALFGLFQGGIIPMYAVIVREYFPAGKAGAHIGLIIMATLFGMALGGWSSGMVFDWTGSYRAAFFMGVLWNLVNLAVVAAIIWRRRPAPALA